MSRNGPGVYSLPAGYEAVTGETATASQHNTPLEDLETDANTARPVVAGGTGATTAAAARSNLGVTAWKSDVSGALTSSGSANAQTLTTNQSLSANADGEKLSFVAGFTNTGAATLNVDGNGAKAIRKLGDIALAPADIIANAHYIVQYDASANSAAGAWLLINPSSTPADARWNFLHNYNGAVNSRGASSGISDDEYGHDRHYALTQANDIDVSTVSAPGDNIGQMMRLDQDNASAQRMGYAQIVQAADTYKLRGQVVTLGGFLRYSNAAAVRYAILEWTGTADSVTSDVVNDWTSGTYTAGTFFNSTTLTVVAVGSTTPSAATITAWSQVGTISSSANNIIVLYWTEGTAAQNSTLDMIWALVQGDVSGSSNMVPHRHVSIDREMCQLFAERLGAGASGRWINTTTAQIGAQFKTEKRSATLTVTTLNTTPQIVEPGVGTKTGSGSAVTLINDTGNGGAYSINGFTGATAGNAALLITDAIHVSCDL